MPFAFMYGDGLLMSGSWLDIASACITAGIGVVLLSIGIEGFWKEPLTTPARIGFGLSGLLFIFPSTTAIAIGVLLTAFSMMMTPHLRFRMKLSS
ncbi:hypothetical protein [Marinobacterium aestuariivivens]|uniref:Uncharacterized protein n=1 Tax=Marinobacterium aestuariivivens TaxID=1698799 RepID=A0ABW2A9J1_9GAMM